MEKELSEYTRVELEEMGYNEEEVYDIFHGGIKQKPDIGTNVIADETVATQTVAPMISEQTDLKTTEITREGDELQQIDEK